MESAAGSVSEKVKAISVVTGPVSVFTISFSTSHGVNSYGSEEVCNIIVLEMVLHNWQHSASTLIEQPTNSTVKMHFRGLMQNGGVIYNSTWCQ